MKNFILGPIWPFRYKNMIFLKTIQLKLHVAVTSCKNPEKFQAWIFHKTWKNLRPILGPFGPKIPKQDVFQKITLHLFLSYMSSRKKYSGQADRRYFIEPSPCVSNIDSVQLLLGFNCLMSKEWLPPFLLQA